MILLSGSGRKLAVEIIKMSKRLFSASLGPSQTHRWQCSKKIPFQTISLLDWSQAGNLPLSFTLSKVPLYRLEFLLIFLAHNFFISLALGVLQLPELERLGQV